jgi:hypothetical protein
MFKMYRAGQVRGDCTAPYDVELDKEYTVSEFVNTVLTRKEWGYIGIYCKGEIFGKPKCEYRGDKLLYALPDNVLNKKVIKVKADGGWSRMDYLLWVEEKGLLKKIFRC